VGGELTLGPDAMIELKDRVRAERSGVAQLFCFFCRDRNLRLLRGYKCSFSGDSCGFAHAATGPR